MVVSDRPRHAIQRPTLDKHSAYPYLLPDWRSFIRARINVDLNKPLVDGMWVPWLNGGKSWVNVKYERLQNFCYNCGVGHDQKNCSEEKAMSMVREGKERYRPWLGTTTCIRLCWWMKVLNGRMWMRRNQAGGKMGKGTMEL